jgi:hypothetical protein
MKGVFLREVLNLIALVGSVAFILAAVQAKPWSAILLVCLIFFGIPGW